MNFDGNFRICGISHLSQVTTFAKSVTYLNPYRTALHLGSTEMALKHSVVAGGLLGGLLEEMELFPPSPRVESQPAEWATQMWTSSIIWCRTK